MSAEIFWTTVQSSHIVAIGYLGDVSVLYVRFTDGRLYRYPGVPRALYARLLGAESKGSFLHRNVLPQYPGERVEETK